MIKNSSSTSNCKERKNIDSKRHDFNFKNLITLFCLHYSVLTAFQIQFFKSRQLIKNKKPIVVRTRRAKNGNKKNNATSQSCLNNCLFSAKFIVQCTCGMPQKWSSPEQMYFHSSSFALGNMETGRRCHGCSNVVYNLNDKQMSAAGERLLWALSHVDRSAWANKTCKPFDKYLPSKL